MKLNVMLDLETMGTEPDAPVISIGAVVYDLEGTTIIDAFHVGVTLASAMALGAKPSADTIMWWLAAERDDARRAWLALEKVDLASALFGFSEWYENSGKGAPVWGNGATFDNVLIRKSFSLAGLECPWPFWKDRCFRTVKGDCLAVIEPLSGEMEALLPGVPHDALYDATRQALHHQRIYRWQYPPTPDFSEDVGG